jgi:hypothetical protein
MVNEMRKLHKELREKAQGEKHTPYFNLLRNQITGNPSHNQADNAPENLQGLYSKLREEEKGAFKKLVSERRTFLQALLDSGNVTGTDRTTCKTNLEDLESVAKTLGLENSGE